MERDHFRNEWPINLNSIEAVKDFVVKAAKVDIDLYLCSTEGPYVINAKSIMGIFSLDLANPHLLCTDFEGAEVDAFRESIKEYLL